MGGENSQPIAPPYDAVICAADGRTDGHRTGPLASGVGNYCKPDSEHVGGGVDNGFVGPFASAKDPVLPAESGL